MRTKFVKYLNTETYILCMGQLITTLIKLIGRSIAILPHVSIKHILKHYKFQDLPREMSGLNKAVKLQNPG